MKRLISFCLCIFTLFTLSACGYSEKEYTAAIADARSLAYSDGYEAAKSEAYEEGLEAGLEEGYQNGYKEGRAEGYDSGFEAGEDSGHYSGYSEGYKEGYDQGKSDAEASLSSYYGSGRTGGGSGGSGSGGGGSFPSYASTPLAQTYIGNKNSKVFHLPTCSSLPAQKNQVLFNSREEAINAGYRPCQRCNP